tara:strand:- start:783 stop:1703 length:921 start_codon:yes stop_codon:yes gene_type:complete
MILFEEYHSFLSYFFTSMNLRQLRTLTALLDQHSFSAAGERVGLSQSAVSVQMRQLEEDLGASLFDRNSRPPQLTETGENIALLAQDVLGQIEHIRSVAASRIVVDTVSIGFISTALPTLLPTVLSGLRERYPDIEIAVKFGLSEELAYAVARQELDFAIQTVPRENIPELVITEIASEPLYVIGPLSQADATSDAELAQRMPFIFFTKAAWLGQQIAARLQSRGIEVDEGFEVNSNEAAVQLVIEGFGVSIVPHGFLSPPLSEQVVRIPFCRPVEVRKLALISSIQSGKIPIAEAIHDILAEAAA